MTNSTEMKTRLSVVVSNRVLSFDDIDWAELRSRTVPNFFSGSGLGTWPAGRLIATTENLLAGTIDGYLKNGKEMLGIQDNEDLTPEAKARQQKAIVDRFVGAINDLILNAEKDMQTLSERAREGLLSVLPRDAADNAGTVLDVEIRTYLRGLQDQERHAVLREAQKGDTPEYVQAALRAAAGLSGLSKDQAKTLNNAGVAATHAEALKTLHEFTVISQSIRRTVNAAVKNLGALAPSAAMELNQQTIAWRDGSKASRELSAWLQEIPYV